MKNMYASLFGESPETKQAREVRNATFQGMLNSRRHAAEQERTDSVKMARYNALGNVLTTMVQPLGWAIGGSTGGVQKYDDRQYIDAFNRAVKASDDLRNIGTAEDQYRFNLAEQDYNRRRDFEDTERKYEYQMEKQQRAYEQQLEKQQKEYEYKQALQEQKDAAKQTLEEWKATHKVTSKSTGLTVADRVLLKEIEAYNKEVAPLQAQGKPFDTFDVWASKRGYNVTSTNPARTTVTPPTGGGSGRTTAQL